MSAAREQARAERTRGRRTRAVAVHEQRSQIELYADAASCRHCDASVEHDPDQGWLLVHTGTRSRRCAGADATTEAEIGFVPL